MVPRPFCLILEYSYPFELQPVTRCRCWHGQPRCRDPHRLSGSYSPNQTSAGTSRSAKDLDAYQDALAVKAVRATTGEGTSSCDQGRAAVICFKSGRSAAGE